MPTYKKDKTNFSVQLKNELYKTTKKNGLNCGLKLVDYVRLILEREAKDPVAMRKQKQVVG